jgi:predicted nucleic acid-binding protein
MRELGDSVVLSAQVLNEFYVAATTKLREPVSADDAASAVESLSRLPIVPVDLPLVRDGIAISRSAMISLWDGLIVAAAIAGGCTRLFTEDLQDRQTFGPVTVENPFRARG